MCAYTGITETIPELNPPTQEKYDYRYWRGITVVSPITTTMTTEEDYNIDDLREATAVEVAHQTTRSSMTSSSSRGAGFYFNCALLVVGVVGVATNGLVLYAMAAAKQHKKQILIFNQNALDLANCLVGLITYAVALSNIYLSGTSGYWLCLTVLSNAVSVAAFFGSLINLAAISIERYLKIVHNAWAQKKLRNWMIYSTVAFTWISGIIYICALHIPTTFVENGVCYSGILFLSPTGRKAYWMWNFLSFYVTDSLLFIYCYGRILVAIRRQARVMAAHSGQASNTAQDQSNKIQTSIIKTMILVSGLFAVTFAPCYIYSFLLFFVQATIDENHLWTVLSVGYLYISINPFIYAINFDPVRRVLLGLIPCKTNVHTPSP